ncbi:tetratricopeptide repeat protein [Tunturiibacter gelidoferens]|uniref:Tetratricopeptide repeat protein n=2 Tax=Tunturiibacter gelidiferens TaxID=3069689 RepID=A0AAU7Z652_9BACT|nr:tetratricopeptide repeat protein [Edaphobacter lichenicola]MBB5339912.1 tetratricopeptide (TPR) repeat protein [Edaphobacter lichenicola]
MDKLPQDGLFVAKAMLIGWMALSKVAFSQEPSAALKKADAAYRAGQAALAQKDLSAAQADFEQVVQLAPQAEQGHSALGAVLVSRGQVKEGIHELERALAIKSSDSTAQMNLAMAYEQIGSPEKAIPLFSRWEVEARLEKRPLPSYVLAGYARSLAANHQIGLAVTKMKAALTTDSQNAGLHDELGSLHAQQKDWAHARGEFAKAIQLNPNLAVAHLHLGLVMQAQGDKDGMSELMQAAQLAPQDAMIALEFGKALVAEWKDEQAIPVFQQALELEPNSIAASYQLALALQRSNRAPEAIVLLRKVVAAEPNNAEAMTNLGMALCQAQEAKDALPVLERSVALAPESVTAHQNLAAAYVQLSQFGDAVVELRRALKLEPDAPQLHYNLGLAFKLQDDAVGAIPELETAQRLDPSAPEAPYLLGVLYMQTGRYEDAAREMNVSLKLRPENGDGWATLGSVYDKLNKLPEATSALREAIRQLPGQPDPHLTLAAVLVKQNQPGEASAERRKAAELMRSNMNRQRAEVATNAGNSALRNNDVASSITQFQDALSYDANYAEAHLGLAAALDRQGKTAEAAAERQKAEAVKTLGNP